MALSELVVQVDGAEHGLDDVYMACYPFVGDFFVFLDRDADGRIRVLFKGRRPWPAKVFLALKKNFQNELIESAIRRNISQSNDKLSEYIISQAVLQGPAEGDENVLVADNGGEIDDELEREIQKLLAEVEKAGGADPLKNEQAPAEAGVAVQDLESMGEDSKGRRIK